VTAESRKLQEICMPLFVADPSKCQRDGACVAECPVRIIELRAGEPAPSVRPEAEEFCRRCGHCVAVCPHGAVTCTGTGPEELPPVPATWPLGRPEVTHLLRARRSVRGYASRPVERDTLRALIDVARFAPSGSNRQPVHWFIIHEAGEVRRLAGLVVDWMRHGLPAQAAAAQRNTSRYLGLWDAGTDVICRGTPHLIVASAAAEPPASGTDCIIALTYLELAAPSFGLGACWAGFFMAAARQWAPLRQALDLPDGHVPYGAMMLGYPRFRYHRLPLRNEARVSWQHSAE
jgi:nitroreductase/NAD-dependent dihydropyrimidine dehydrogenase PreA subunit